MKKYLLIISCIISTPLFADEKEVQLLKLAETGDVSMVKSIVQSGVDVNTKDANGFTPLILASFQGHKGVADILIGAKADVNLKTKDGHTALMLTCLNGHPDVVRALIAARADVNVQAKDGFTALIMAAQNGHAEIVNLLIPAKANVNAKLPDGYTALMSAAEHNRAEAAKALLAAKADVNAKNVHGLTPLIFAVLNQNLDMARLLIGGKADVNARYNDGVTAIMAACMNGQVEMVKLLIASGGNVNANKDGTTPLMIAALNGHKGIALVLIESGADVNAKMSSGLTAAEIAEEKGHKDLAKLLKSRAGQDAIGAESDDPEYLKIADYIKQGNAFYLKRDYKKAITPYEKGLELERKKSRLGQELLSDLVNNLGVSYRITGDFKKARETLEYGITRDKTNPLMYYNLACTFAEMNDVDNTMANLKQAFDNNTEGQVPYPFNDDSLQRFMKNERFLYLLQTYTLVVRNVRLEPRVPVKLFDAIEVRMPANPPPRLLMNKEHNYRQAEFFQHCGGQEPCFAYVVDIDAIPESAKKMEQISADVVSKLTVPGTVKSLPEIESLTHGFDRTRVVIAAAKGGGIILLGLYSDAKAKMTYRVLTMLLYSERFPDQQWSQVISSATSVYLTIRKIEP